MSYIDPSSLAMSNEPTSPSYGSPSPSPASPSHDLPTSSNLMDVLFGPEVPSQPSRKRARTELSSDERKEARAHRNRIAAQNSRDRRKAQFTYLERRVQELEDENRRLRAGIPMQPPPQPMHVHPAPHLTSLPNLASLASVAASAAAGMPMRNPEEELRIAREQERERENEELKERIKTLERGWDAVVKALAAQGLPTAPSSANTSISTTTNPGLASSSATTPSPTSSSGPINNILSLNGFAAFPSPAPSHTSLDVNELDLSAIPSSTPFALQPSIHTQQLSSSPLSAGLSASPVSEPVSVPSIDKNSTRHLARVAYIGPSGLMSLQRASKAGLGLLGTTGYLPSPSISDDDDDFGGCDEDAKMEDLFREIFVESAAPAAKDDAAGDGLSEAAPDAGALWVGEPEPAQAKVSGAGEAGGEDGQGVEGPAGEKGVSGSGLEQVLGAVTVGEKRKREDEDNDEEERAPAALSDEEMQQMLSDMEVSMMMGSFDPSLNLPLAVDNFGALDMGLLGFDEGNPLMDFSSGPDFGGMWLPTNSSATVPGVF
ncbi:hypothetical protein DFP72DRAFT_1164208 [Ephemerocybe angulata]|uniref:X-box-binding protein 1 n=1 Tax=Ephemerocybe angulata TaxID=980116 RepID=A0A8H6IF81_9AGAR|nr:hypothetical protein DFP72DRAFT_1164208 [Tulosesus angulatus]